MRHIALYLPFGVGPKACMASNFGHMQVKAAAMTIVRDFEIQAVPVQGPIVQNPTSFQWHAQGLRLKFQPRNQS